MPAYHAQLYTTMVWTWQKLAHSSSDQVAGLKPDARGAPIAVGFSSADRPGQMEVCAAWLFGGYLQYLWVGNYRLPCAGGVEAWTFHDRLALIFWSWFALILLAIRAAGFYRRVRDAHRLGRQLADLVFSISELRGSYP